MINKIDYKKGFEYAFNNTKAHFNAAELLASNINYGLANSHLILAAEEAVKAYIIFTKHYDSELEIPDFNKYFENHKHKHNTIRDMTFFFSLLMQMSMISIKPTLRLLKKNKKNISEKELKEKFEKGIDNLIDYLNSVPKIDNNEQWWNEANNNKNRGFYVNIINNSWQSPNQITEQDYYKSLKIVQEIIEWLSIIPSIENDPDVQKRYQELKNIDRNIPKI